MSLPIKTDFVKLSVARRFCKERGKRISADFMVVLDNHVRRKLNSACAVHNGGKKTLDASVAGYVGLTNNQQNTQP